MFEPVGKLNVIEDYWTIMTKYRPTDVTDLIIITCSLLEDENRVCMLMDVKRNHRCMIQFQETKAIIVLLKMEQKSLNKFSGRQTERALDFIGEGLH